MEPRIQYAQTTDGVNIAFWTLGEGEPLVYMPVLRLSHVQLEWQRAETRSWYERLIERRRLIRYDARGTGLSDRTRTDYSVDSLALDLAAGGGPSGPGEIRPLRVRRRWLLRDLLHGPPSRAGIAPDPLVRMGTEARAGATAAGQGAQRPARGGLGALHGDVCAYDARLVRWRAGARVRCLYATELVPRVEPGAG